MQTKPHTTFITAIVGIVVALTVAAPAAFSRPASEPPAFPSAVPSQPGQPTGAPSAANPARAQEQYYTSYGKPQSLSRPEASVDSGGIDWTAIGISLGATIILVSALIALSTRTRRRTHRVRVVA